MENRRGPARQISIRIPFQHEDRDELSEKGINVLDNLKIQVSRLEANWKAQVQYPELFRHHMLTPACGNVGKAQYTSFIEAWSSPQTPPPDIPKQVLDQIVSNMVNSIPSKGLGTVKCSITITYKDAVYPKEPKE